MKSNYILPLDRSEFNSENILELENILKDYIGSEGYNFTKTSIVPVSDLNNEQKEELYIDFNNNYEYTFGTQEIKNVNFYNEYFYILETIINNKK